MRPTNNGVVEVPEFCTNGVADHTQLLGVVGVFTVDEGSRRALRDELRRTWMRASVRVPQSLYATFVARGRGPAAAALRAEAKQHGGDILFVDADSALPRSIGPLVTLLEWWQCAAIAWPAAQLIGKADDDVTCSAQQTNS